MYIITSGFKGPVCRLGAQGKAGSVTEKSGSQIYAFQSA